MLESNVSAVLCVYRRWMKNLRIGSMQVNAVKSMNRKFGGKTEVWMFYEKQDFYNRTAWCSLKANFILCMYALKKVTMNGSLCVQSQLIDAKDF